MKYMLLVHHDEEAFGKFSETKRLQMLEESVQLTHQLHANGKYLSASPLHPAATAAIVRVRDGKSFVTDGPFVETREQIAGYFLIHAKDLDEAIGIAARVPGGAHRNRRGPARKGDRGPAGRLACATSGSSERSAPICRACIKAVPQTIAARRRRAD